MNFQLVIDSQCDNLFAFLEGDKNEGIWLFIKSLKKEKLKRYFYQVRRLVYQGLYL